jgi:hypothetical protein
MTKDDIKKLLDVTVKDPFSADCWMKEKKIEDGISWEEFNLNVYIGSTTHPKEFENVVNCYLVNNQAHNTRSAIIYLGDQGIESTSMRHLIEESTRLGISILILKNKTSGLGKSETIFQSIRENIVRIIRGLGYLGLRRDLVDLNRIYLWGQGVNGLSCLLSLFCHDRSYGLILEKTPAEVGLDISDGEPGKSKSASGRSRELGELMSLVAPFPIGVFNPVRDGIDVSQGELDKMFAGTKDIYRSHGAGEALRVEISDSDVVSDFLKWLTKVS